MKVSIRRMLFALVAVVTLGIVAVPANAQDNHHHHHRHHHHHHHHNR